MSKVNDGAQGPEGQSASNKIKNENDLAKEAFQRFVSSSGGQIWVRNMVKGCFVMQETFTGNSKTFYNEGMRNVANGILKQTAEVNPDAFATIMKEVL